MISLIVAKASNGVIGNKNDLPWYLPADLRHFKEVTTGHTVVMGRNTFDSIFYRLKGPLPKRRNVIVSSSMEAAPVGFEVVRSLQDAVSNVPANEKVYIIGGAVLYKAALDSDVVEELVITDVDAAIAGDTYFPKIDWSRWQKLSEQAYSSDEKNKYDYTFTVYRKK